MAISPCYEIPDDLSGDALKAYALRCGEEVAYQQVIEQTGIDPRLYIKDGKIDWVAVGVGIAEYETGVDLDPSLFNEDGSVNWRTVIKNAGAIGASAFCTAYGAGAVAPVCSWVGGIAAGVLYDELGRPVYDVAAGIVEGVAEAASAVGDLVGLGPDDPEPIRGTDVVFLRPSERGDIDALVSWYAAYEKDACRNMVALRFLAVVAAETIEAMRFLWQRRTGKKTTWAEMYARFVANGLAMPSGWGNCLGPWVGIGALYHEKTWFKNTGVNANTPGMHLRFDEVGIARDVMGDHQRTAFDLTNEQTLSPTTIFEFKKLDYSFWSQEGILGTELYVEPKNRPVRTFYLDGGAYLKNRVPMNNPALVSYIVDGSLPSINPSLASPEAKRLFSNFFPVKDTARASWPLGHYWDSKPYYPYDKNSLGTVFPLQGAALDDYNSRYYSYIDKADVTYIPAIRYFAKTMPFENQVEARAKGMRSIALAMAATRKDLRRYVRLRENSLSSATSPSSTKRKSASFSWGWTLATVATGAAGYIGYRLATNQPVVPRPVTKYFKEKGNL